MKKKKTFQFFSPVFLSIVLLSCSSKASGATQVWQEYWLLTLIILYDDKMEIGD